jgi:hypothetical protein
VVTIVCTVLTVEVVGNSKVGQASRERASIHSYSGFVDSLLRRARKRIISEIDSLKGRCRYVTLYTST